MVVERDMQKTTGIPVIGVGVLEDCERERFSRRMTREDRSGLSGPLMAVTMKLLRTPRYAHSRRIPTDRYLACCTIVSYRMTKKWYIVHHGGRNGVLLFRRALLPFLLVAVQPLLLHRWENGKATGRHDRRVEVLQIVVVRTPCEPLIIVNTSQF